MNKFTASCKDVITGKEIVLSNCTYNQACSYLDHVVNILSIKPVGKLTGLYCGIWFYYDEERGYLLKD